MYKITHQVRAEHWARILNECVNSRTAVESITAFKLLFPILGILLTRYCPCVSQTPMLHGISCVIFDSMADTVTYLLGLLMMADIQKPSANVIRSLLLLFLNYIEVSLEMTYFYYVYGSNIKFKKALTFANAGLKFFFLTVVFGYLVQHMRQRKFKDL